MKRSLFYREVVKDDRPDKNGRSSSLFVPSTISGIRFLCSISGRVHAIWRKGSSRRCQQRMKHLHNISIFLFSAKTRRVTVHVHSTLYLDSFPLQLQTMNTYMSLKSRYKRRFYGKEKLITRFLGKYSIWIFYVYLLS